MDGGRRKTPLLLAEEVRQRQAFKGNLNLGCDHSSRDVQASARVLARALGTNLSLQS